MFSPEDRKGWSCRWEEPSLHQLRFGCYEGELHPGLSGWMKERAEVLELLTFWKPEQQAVPHFRIWRPPQINAPPPKTIKILELKH